MKMDESRSWDWKINSESGTRKVTFNLDDTSNSETITAAPLAQRPQRTRQPPPKLYDYEMILDSAITADGYLVHLALYSETEPVDFTQALQDNN